MSKKNLDKIFQEKFKDYSDFPTEKVWKSIESSLNKKKKTRTVIPLWWKLGGIAAVLAIGMFLINPFKDQDNETNPISTEVENVKEKQQEEVNPIDDLPIANTPQVAEGSKSDNTQKIKTNAIDPSLDRTRESDSQTTSMENGKTVKNGNTKSVFNEPKPASSRIATANKKDGKARSVDKFKDVTTQDKESVIAINEAAKSTKKPALNEDFTQSGNEKNGKENSDENTEETIAQVNTEDPDKKTAEGKKSIFDEIAEQEEESEVAETAKGKWSAGPSIAPVYFNAIGEGSPVSSIFVPNSKSGDVNLSYGLAVSYEINKKLSIKTGVHKVDYGYNTNDVQFSSTLTGFGNGQIDNIDYSRASRNIVVESKATVGNSLTENSTLEVSAQDPSLLGVMAQQFGYLEVPLELNYTLLDRKFGINLIGGMSSLFLIDNSVTLTSGELITEMGEANNVNDVNFSTNIGFGVNYKFSPKIQLNIEPVFKYQLNTFSDTSGNFQPFSVGVYSGLNFRF